MTGSKDDASMDVSGITKATMTAAINQARDNNTILETSPSHPCMKIDYTPAVMAPAGSGLTASASAKARYVFKGVEYETSLSVPNPCGVWYHQSRGAHIISVLPRRADEATGVSYNGSTEQISLSELADCWPVAPFQNDRPVNSTLIDLLHTAFNPNAGKARVHAALQAAVFLRRTGENPFSLKTKGQVEATTTLICGFRAGLNAYNAAVATELVL
jgi:hypothetical protein